MTARPCGRYATHVDHVDPRRGRPGSALTPAGSTRAWRRLRAFVLERDAYRCRVLVDTLTGDVVEAPRPTTPPLGPDDPAWLRATCQDHNLTRGAALTDARPNASSSTDRPPTRWEW